MRRDNAVHNAFLGWWWADLVAALAMVPFLVRECRDGLSDGVGSTGDLLIGW